MSGGKTKFHEIFLNHALTIETDDNETLEGDIISVNGSTGFAFYSVEDYFCLGAFIDSDDLELFEDEGIDSDVGDLGIVCDVDGTECIGSFD